jgi:CheY-like chemotaxis protein
VQALEGYSAIVVAQKEQLIILDLDLAAGDGFAVLERLQDSDTLSNIPLIILTTGDPQSNEQKTLQAGAAACFQKPADNFASRLMASIIAFFSPWRRTKSVTAFADDMRRS